MNVHKTRPAETTGGLVGVATAITALAGADTTSVAVVGTLAGMLPAAVTLLVTNGGIRGVFRALWRGKETGQGVVDVLLIVLLVLLILFLAGRV